MKSKKQKLSAPFTYRKIAVFFRRRRRRCRRRRPRRRRRHRRRSSQFNAGAADSSVASGVDVRGTDRTSLHVRT
jgi:hypothetical protein